MYKLLLIGVTACQFEGTRQDAPSMPMTAPSDILEVSPQSLRLEAQPGNRDIAPVIITNTSDSDHTVSVRLAMWSDEPGRDTGFRIASETGNRCPRGGGDKGGLVSCVFNLPAKSSQTVIVNFAPAVDTQKDHSVDWLSITLSGKSDNNDKKEVLDRAEVSVIGVIARSTQPSAIMN